MIVVIFWYFWIFIHPTIICHLILKFAFSWMFIPSGFVLYSSFNNYLYFVSFAIYLFAGLYIFLNSSSPWKLLTFCLVFHLFFLQVCSYSLISLPQERVEMKLNWARKYTPLFNFLWFFYRADPLYRLISLYNPFSNFLLLTLFI